MARLALVLAGGQSKRFGRDKAAVELDGRPLLERLVELASGVADEVLVVGTGHALPDLEPHGGPVQAVVAGTRARPGADWLLLACDLPRLSPALLAALVRPLPAGVDARIPRLDGHAQPLCAYYAAGCAATFEAVWAEGRRALGAATARLAVEWVEPAALGVEATTLADFDTPEDLAALGL